MQHGAERRQKGSRGGQKKRLFKNVCNIVFSGDISEKEKLG